MIRRFCKENLTDFKTFLYHAIGVHDAEIQEYIHNVVTGEISFSTTNKYTKINMHWRVLGVSVVVWTSGPEIGQNGSINYAGVEEDYSCPVRYSTFENDDLHDCVYMLFEMFSGDQLHIVSEEVFVEETTE